jgi:hypothetical protein
LQPVVRQRIVGDVREYSCDRTVWIIYRELELRIVVVARERNWTAKHETSIEDVNASAGCLLTDYDPDQESA